MNGHFPDAKSAQCRPPHRRQDWRLRWCRADVADDDPGGGIVPREGDADGAARVETTRPLAEVLEDGQRSSLVAGAVPLWVHADGGLGLVGLVEPSGAGLADGGGGRAGSSSRARRAASNTSAGLANDTSGSDLPFSETARASGNARSASDSASATVPIAGSPAGFFRHVRPAGVRRRPCATAPRRSARGRVRRAGGPFSGVDLLAGETQRRVGLLEAAGVRRRVPRFRQLGRRARHGFFAVRLPQFRPVRGRPRRRSVPSAGAA